MSEEFYGQVEIQKSLTETDTTILLNGQNGKIRVGGHGSDGEISLYRREADFSPSDDEEPSIVIKGRQGYIQTYSFKTGNSVLQGYNDTLILGETPSEDDHTAFLPGTDLPGTDDMPTPSAAIALRGDRGDILLGCVDKSGDLKIRNGDNQQTMHLEGDGANLWMGGNGRDGDIILFPADAVDVYDPVVGHDLSKATIHLDGDAGDITLSNGDCAEEFDASEAEKVDPGTVMVIEQEDRLQQSTKAYDKKVAGVISGAGNQKPGIILGRQESQDSRMPLALTGKVYCKVDASYAAIEVGDLLTTSNTPGHAMKASNPVWSFGAVIGKALKSLEKGTGLIPILVALQ